MIALSGNAGECRLVPASSLFLTSECASNERVIASGGGKFTRSLGFCKRKKKKLYVYHNGYIQILLKLCYVHYEGISTLGRASAVLFFYALYIC